MQQARLSIASAHACAPHGGQALRWYSPARTGQRTGTAHMLCVAPSSATRLGAICPIMSQGVASKHWVCHSTQRQPQAHLLALQAAQSGLAGVPALGGSRALGSLLA